MALLLCPDCGKKYSSSLESCPDCQSPATTASVVPPPSERTDGQTPMPAAAAPESGAKKMNTRWLKIPAVLLILTVCFHYWIRSEKARMAAELGAAARQTVTSIAARQFREERRERQTTEEEMQAWVNAQPVKPGERLARNIDVGGGWWIGAGSSLISFAAVQGRVDAMEWLKKNGEEIHTKDGSGETPIFSAAWAGHVASMEWLKANGADVNTETRGGGTPMHAAAFGGHVTALQWLKENGGDVNAKSGIGTPMHGAARYGHVVAMEWLKANGADVNAKSDDGKTPFDMASLFDEAEAEKWLKVNGGKSGKEL